MGIAGDMIELKSGQLYVNGKEQTHFPGMQRESIVTTDGTGLNKRVLEQMNIAEDDRHVISNTQYLFPLTMENEQKLKAMKNVKRVEPTNSTRSNYENSFRPGSSFISNKLEIYFNYPENISLKWLIFPYVTIDMSALLISTKLTT